MVLVVEDEPQVMRFLRATLPAQGYRLVEATTGQQGLVEAATRTPDLVLLDLGLPDLDGVEVSGEPTHHAEAALPLGGRRCLGGPLDRRLTPHVGLGAAHGKASEVVQQPGVDRQRESSHPAHGEIPLYGAGQHRAPSAAGQGWAIARSRVTSTLA